MSRVIFGERLNWIATFCLFVLCLTQTTMASGYQGGNPEIILNKSSEGEWVVTYSLVTPAKKLVFVRNPDHSRVKRWTPVQEEHVLEADKNGEYIVHRDGESFKKVSFYLTPTYYSLIKDYAPFSPFSDGGTLIYSGRFFTCVESCNDAQNQWNITLVPPTGEHVIVDGILHDQSVSWEDQDSGRNIYVGKQQPIEDSSFIALIDSKLPKILQSVLITQLPKLMKYFTEQLGEVSQTKPMLYASYSNQPGLSSQGGTLPNQIFMHWDFDDLDERIQSQIYADQTLWFFAHEAAHLFQRTRSGFSLFGESEHSWLHEGGADYLAMRALKDMYPQVQPYIDAKIQQYHQHCSKGLESTALIDAASKGQFMLYYSCGFFVHKKLDEEILAISNNEKDIIDLWQLFSKRVELSKTTGTDIFWQASTELLPADHVKRLKQVLSSKKLDSELFMLNFG